MGYSASRLSNYEGFKRLDKLLEKIAEGRLKPPREAVVDHLCPLCKCRKKSQRLVPSRVIGVPVGQLGVECKTRFQGKFILACADCADDLRRAGVR